MACKTLPGNKRPILLCFRARTVCFLPGYLSAVFLRFRLDLRFRWLACYWHVIVRNVHAGGSSTVVQWHRASGVVGPRSQRLEEDVMGVSKLERSCATHWRPVGRRGASCPPGKGDMRLPPLYRRKQLFPGGEILFSLGGGVLVVPESSLGGGVSEQRRNPEKIDRGEDQFR